MISSGIDKLSQKHNSLKTESGGGGGESENFFYCEIANKNTSKHIEQRKYNT